MTLPMMDASVDPTTGLDLGTLPKDVPTDFLPPFEDLSHFFVSDSAFQNNTLEDLMEGREDGEQQCNDPHPVGKDDGDEAGRVENYVVMRQLTSANVNQSYSDHDYHHLSGLNVDDDDDATRSSIHGDGDELENSEFVPNRSISLRPRDQLRKRCFSSSSFTSGESDVSPDVAYKPHHHAPTTSKRAKTSNHQAASTSSSRGSVSGRQSITDSYYMDKSMSKNAIAARENREKKKQYIQGLERENAQLKQNEKRLKSDVQEKDKTIAALTERVSYLEGVINNKTEIGSLIKSIRNTPGIKSISTSFGSNPIATRGNARGGSRASTSTYDENDASQAWKEQIPPKDKNGICLHVSNGNLSLEYCPTCSKSAKKSLGIK